MRIEFWTDIICPWCGLGAARLDKALAQFGHKDDIELVHKSFQLDERAPMGSAQTARQMLKQKKGMSDRQIDGITKHIEELAAAEGLAPYIVTDNRVGNTSLAHELAAWATDIGHGPAVWSALYTSYFGKGDSIFDVESLVALAASLGLDAEAARTALTSRRYMAQVLREGREARELGANGVPFIVIDRRYGIAGAEPTEVLLDALQTAWDEQPAHVTSSNPDATCGPEGCAVPASGDHAP
jgi:predicted DsbA family dithiol-disulfide isomerase